MTETEPEQQQVLDAIGRLGKTEFLLTILGLIAYSSEQSEADKS